VNAVAVVVPGGIDDPARVSGGNRYDRRVCDGLRDDGWAVDEVAVPGSWPRPGPAELAQLARALDARPDGALVLVDGLIGSAAGAVLVPRSARLRLVVLAHMVFGGDAVPEVDERAALGAARAVVATSGWTRRLLLDRYGLTADRVSVARPGTDRAPVGPGTAAGGRLLCVGAVSPVKGQDVLFEALTGTAGPWRCAVVGPADRDPPYAAALERRAVAAGLADRVRWAGVRTGARLAAEHRDADLLVVPSRSESYGMVVGEALAAGLPVLASAVGGIPEALGRTPSGVPGMLVPPDDAGALAAALGRWLTDAGLRRRLRRAALLRREGLPRWRSTTAQVGGVLAAVLGEPEPAGVPCSPATRHGGRRG
jgi:glycosyltransferase involved in cell wall biosynthesis